MRDGADAETAAAQRWNIAGRRAKRWTPERVERFVEVLPWVLGVVVWQLVSVLFETIPGPVAVLDFLLTEVPAEDLWSGVVTTSARFWTGLAIALVVGVVIGLLLGGSKIGRGFFKDPIIVGLALPSFPWALLGAMWFGVGFVAPTMTVVLVAVPFIAINVAEGVEAISRDLQAMSRVYGVPLSRRIRSLFLPAIVGHTVAGFRVAVIVGWNGVLITEWFAGSSGIGFQAHYWYIVPSFEGFLALALLFITYIVVVDRLVVETIYRRTQRWRSKE